MNVITHAVLFGGFAGDAAFNRLARFIRTGGKGEAHQTKTVLVPVDEHQAELQTDPARALGVPSFRGRGGEVGGILAVHGERECL
ncbi:MAG: hypothetical protein IPI01_06250 [Ignavibacteriae bacterium]|nr:hypothetical protein [Ignavibacteriota bacterium]